MTLPTKPRAPKAVKAWAIVDSDGDIWLGADGELTIYTTRYAANNDVGYRWHEELKVTRVTVTPIPPKPAKAGKKRRVK